MIRTVMLIAPVGRERDLEYVADRLDGAELSPEGDANPVSLPKPRIDPAPKYIDLFTPPKGKFIRNDYLNESDFGRSPSHVWHSVTPVVLDGHNRKSKNEKPDVIAERTKQLIRVALQRAGVETPCDFVWQAIPFLKNCLSAHKYDRDGRHTGYHRPQHLKTLTAVHVKIWFHDGSEQKRPIVVPGPLTLGAGRHCGFGLMAAVSD
jgi:CRISPR-associated protein Csb2